MKCESRVEFLGRFEHLIRPKGMALLLFLLVGYLPLSLHHGLRRREQSFRVEFVPDIVGYIGKWVASTQHNTIQRILEYFGQFIPHRALIQGKIATFMGS